MAASRDVTHDGTTMLVTTWRSAGVERMQQLLVGGAGLGHTFESMSKPTYPAARQVAEKVHRYFTEHLTSQPRLEPSNAAPTPDVEALEAIIDAAFWASLRREEGYPPRISLVFLPPPQSGARLMLERPLPLTPEDLTRLAPAVERPGIHLGIWRNGAGLSVWGATRTIPAFCFVLEVASPGVLVIKHSRAAGSSKFVNFAVLESDQVKILKRDSARQPDSPALLASLLASDAPSPGDARETFASLAVSMRAHGRGGSLLVVPARTETWRESVVLPIRYAVAPAFTRLADLIQDAENERDSRLWQEGFQRAIDGTAGLTAVDGATVITDQYEVLAFGASIRRRDGAAQVEQVVLIEPIEGNIPRVVDVVQLGGTRHLSAAQFVQDQQDAVAFVASQDGRFTVFAWSREQKMVHAYRVEAFLL